MSTGEEISSPPQDGHLDEPPATVASWIRDHVLDSVGMMDVPAQR